MPLGLGAFEIQPIEMPPARPSRVELYPVLEPELPAARALQ